MLPPARAGVAMWSEVAGGGKFELASLVIAGLVPFLMRWSGTSPAATALFPAISIREASRVCYRDGGTSRPLTERSGFRGELPMDAGASAVKEQAKAELHGQRCPGRHQGQRRRVRPVRLPISSPAPGCCGRSRASRSSPGAGLQGGRMYRHRSPACSFATSAPSSSFQYTGFLDSHQRDPRGGGRVQAPADLHGDRSRLLPGHQAGTRARAIGPLWGSHHRADPGCDGDRA